MLPGACGYYTALPGDDIALFLQQETTTKTLGSPPPRGPCLGRFPGSGNPSAGALVGPGRPWTLLGGGVGRR